MCTKSVQMEKNIQMFSKMKVRKHFCLFCQVVGKKMTVMVLRDLKKKNKKNEKQTHVKIISLKIY